jgi:hypothetical protein
VAVLSNSIVAQEFERVPAAYGANEYGQRVVTGFNKIPGMKFVVQNYETTNAAVGETIWVKAIRVGTTDYNGQRLELWDHGKPHVVMVVTTNYPGAVSTVEYRMVRAEKYDVSKPPFISVTIPAGAALENAGEIHYSPEAPKPCNVVFQIPAIYNLNKPVEVDIKNFPYSPSYFQSGKWQSKNREDLAAAKIIGGNQSHTRSSGPKTALEKQRESEEDAIALKAKGNLMRYGTIVDGLVTKEPIALRLFPLSPPRTNSNAMGVISITPAQPDFDYGTPATAADELNTLPAN